MIFGLLTLAIFGLLTLALLMMPLMMPCSEQPENRPF